MTTFTNYLRGSLDSDVCSFYSGRIPAEGWPSGQWQQTVNLSTNVYVGSNPTPSTTLNFLTTAYFLAGLEATLAFFIV